MNSLQSLGVNYIVDHPESLKPLKGKEQRLTTDLSNEIAMKLFQKENLPEDDILQCLNVSEFDVPSADSSLAVEAVKKIFKPELWMTSLEKISFPKSDFSKVQFPQTCKFDKLKNMVITNPMITDEQLHKFISLLPSKLENLTISDCKSLTNEHLQRISECCPNLVSLDVSDCSEISSFENCGFKKLVAAKLGNTGLDDQSLQNFCKQHRETLKKLDLSDTEIESFANCDLNALEELNLSSTHINNETLQQISHQYGKTLKKFDVSANKITSFDNCDFCSLEEIDLGDTQITTKNLQELSKQCGKTLKKLDLTATKVTSFEGCDFSALTEINLRALKLSNEDLKKLSQQYGETLKKLSLYNCTKLDFFVGNCKGFKFKVLEEIDTRATKLTKRCIQALEKECSIKIKKIIS